MLFFRKKKVQELIPAVSFSSFSELPESISVSFCSALRYIIFDKTQGWVKFPTGGKPRDLHCRMNR